MESHKGDVKTIRIRSPVTYASVAHSMIGENRQLVTDEPVEFEK
jgi:hypothetical protein